jgi:2-hydroxychromene-2-carboxylate isomerase
MPAIDFYFDITSPYTYLASQRLPAMAAERGVTVRYRPFLLGAVFKATGNNMPALVPSRGSYMLEDLKRWSAKLGIPFSFPAFFPVNSLLAMRALCTFQEDEIRGAADRVFHAYWVKNLDVSMPEVLSDLVGADAVAGAAEPEIKLRLRENTDEAVRQGAFGAPSFVVGEELFFGNDRVEFALDAAVG